REAGEPLQYILGEAPFWGRDFRVGPGVLIPRRDTETLVRAALSLVPSPPPDAFTFLDWGTGSGCIAATLLLEFPEASALMVERSPAALEYAQENLSRYGLEARARLIRSETPEDISLAGDERCAFVISNPPYIPTGDIPGLMREVRDHEPHEALDGGPDGMALYRALFRNVPRWLRPGGFLILEVGDVRQAKALRHARFGDFSFVEAFMDDSQFPRCMVWKGTAETR
ncbi:MAG: peptide chain release factor N(5)-glutamine methyltransferase, partial [Fretibacterium sp.]|nr:peptide chain release factor N(5)-glutamine methyltransferase [Fretibacterium sp.]